MKRKRYTEEQIIGILKAHESGIKLADLIREHGMSEQSFYRWKSKYVGLEPSQVRELEQLQEENARLKMLVADLSLDKAMLQDITSKKW